MPRISDKKYVIKNNALYYKAIGINGEWVDDINNATIFEDFTDQSGTTGYEWAMNMLKKKFENVKLVEVKSVYVEK